MPRVPRQFRQSPNKRPHEIKVSDKTSILLLGKPLPELEAWLSPSFTLHRPVSEGDGFLELGDWAPEIRGIAVCSHVPVKRDLMSRLPGLEIVSCCSVGYDYVDASWAGKHGITVTNTPGVLTEEVADTALYLASSLSRGVTGEVLYVDAGSHIIGL